MFFSELQSEFQRQREEKGYRMECKQRINLSDHAYSVLINDIEAFQVPRKKPEYLPTHTMIKRIFTNFRESADASIANACESKRLALLDQLKTIEPDTTRQEAVNCLLKQFEKELKDSVQQRNRRGNSFVISLDDGFLEELSSDECQRESKYYAERVGAYLKAIIEEYADLPYIERERIYFLDTVNLIQSAVTGGKLKLTLYNTRANGNDLADRVLYFKPVGIYPDSERLYNYLVGFSSENGKKPMRPQSIRLTSIKHIKPAGSASVSNSERDEIIKQIKEKGVQYLSSESGKQKIVVQFTPNGERLYKRLLHLRPRCTKKSGSRIYEFDCTEFQAETYFFKYGADAKILAPQSLADKFLEKYRAALECYQSDLRN